jgi:hypothetical protein
MTEITRRIHDNYVPIKLFYRIVEFELVVEGLMVLLQEDGPLNRSAFLLPLFYKYRNSSTHTVRRIETFYQAFFNRSDLHNPIQTRELFIYVE